MLTALLLLGVFSAGTLTGAGVYRWAAPSRLPPPQRGTFPELIRDLHLVPDQELKVREIGERYRPQLEAMFQELEPRIRAIQDEMEAELRTTLDEEQRRRLDAFQAQRRRSPLRPPGLPDRRGPPPRAAIDACKGKAAGVDCSFTSAAGTVAGSCREPPPDAPPGAPMACAPPDSDER
jgi:hypothetical protein